MRLIILISHLLKKKGKSFFFSFSNGFYRRMAKEDICLLFAAKKLSPYFCNWWFHSFNHWEPPTEAFASSINHPTHQLYFQSSFHLWATDYYWIDPLNPVLFLYIFFFNSPLPSILSMATMTSHWNVPPSPTNESWLYNGSQPKSLSEHRGFDVNL